MFSLSTYWRHLLTEHESSLDSDIKDFLEKIISRHAGYWHPSIAHSNLRSILPCPDKTLPVVDGRLVLGTWRSLVFVEIDVHPWTKNTDYTGT